MECDPAKRRCTDAIANALLCVPAACSVGFEPPRSQVLINGTSPRRAPCYSQVAEPARAPPPDPSHRGQAGTGANADTQRAQTTRTSSRGISPRSSTATATSTEFA